MIYRKLFSASTHIYAGPAWTVWIVSFPGHVVRVWLQSVVGSERTRHSKMELKHMHHLFAFAVVLTTQVPCALAAAAAVYGPFGKCEEKGCGK